MAVIAPAVTTASMDSISREASVIHAKMSSPTALYAPTKPPVSNAMALF